MHVPGTELEPRLVPRSLALSPTVTPNESRVLPVCAGFSSGTLRFITVGLTDEERLFDNVVIHIIYV